jgi:hypothetical protein
MYLLIKKCGIRSVNDTIAHIMHDIYIETGDLKYDNISEAYDEINRKFTLR